MARNIKDVSAELAAFRARMREFDAQPGPAQAELWAKWEREAAAAGGDRGVSAPAPRRKVPDPQRSAKLRGARQKACVVALPRGLAMMATTDSERILLALYRRLAGQGSWQASIREIANRTKLCDRAIQKANQALAAKGLVEIERRRVAARQNAENVYTLTEVGREGLERRRRQKFFAEGGESGDGPKESSLSKNLTSSDTSGLIPPIQSTTQPKGSARPLSSSQSSRPRAARPAEYRGTAPAPGFGESERELLRRGLKHLTGEAAPIDDPGIWTAIEAMRHELAPGMQPGVWNWARRRHGPKAALAVVETAILAGSGWVKTTPGAYLWGILRLAPDECRPAVTLGRLLMARSGTAGRLGGGKT